ncbi:uncharacterized protein LOC129777493 isoform X2 [Toxorhynchites rutilus septentrionalis]|uniref:uncharacterized protein LOC129777493 isoform X2 n=1 Tax=Toxorhynchites rutilus septentrionalis TaxID=329112 RepID=UPI002479C10E|nr:uncharacterized protein LOC129777493 isoform X2 [Toxorhynchites rutilus septentrionalis]
MTTVCRFCLKNSPKLVPLFETLINGELLIEFIRSTLRVEIDTSLDFPREVCQDCLKRVHSLHNFHRRLLESQSLLIQWRKEGRALAVAIEEMNTSSSQANDGSSPEIIVDHDVVTEIIREPVEIKNELLISDDEETTQSRDNGNVRPHPKKRKRSTIAINCRGEHCFSLETHQIASDSPVGISRRSQQSTASALNNKTLQTTSSEANGTSKNPNDCGSRCFPFASFKQEMDKFKVEQSVIIHTAVESAVTKCFDQNFARFASLLGINKTTRRSIPDNIVERKEIADVKTASEKWNLITNEQELVEWNDKLDDSELCQSYLNYFSNIVMPNAYVGKGDNACYIIVDCLFSREFWNQFTWTGINRGQKSKRGFRQFGNVTKLLLDIVRIGDPQYTFQKLETFCKARLFRYSKSRSSSKKLRKSVCRPGRSKANKTCKAYGSPDEQIHVKSEEFVDEGYEHTMSNEMAYVDVDNQMEEESLSNGENSEGAEEYLEEDDD